MPPTLVISGVGFTTITFQQTDGHSISPMPKVTRPTKVRAIAENEPIGVEYSIGQDMGSNSVQIELQGLIVQADLNSLTAFSLTNQFAAAKGALTLALTGGDSIQSWSYANCVLKSISYESLPGSEVFYNYTAKFVQYAGQT